MKALKYIIIIFAFAQLFVPVPESFELSKFFLCGAALIGSTLIQTKKSK